MKYIFALYIFTRIFVKRDLRENMYNAKISTFTVAIKMDQYTSLNTIAIPEFDISRVRFRHPRRVRNRESLCYIHMYVASISDI